MCKIGLCCVCINPTNDSFLHENLITVYVLDISLFFNIKTWKIYLFGILRFHLCWVSTKILRFSFDKSIALPIILWFLNFYHWRMCLWWLISYFLWKITIVAVNKLSVGGSKWHPWVWKIDDRCYKIFFL